MKSNKQRNFFCATTLQPNFARPQNSVESKYLSLKYPRCTSSGCTY